MEKRTDYDILIIGAGALGCALARELSRYAIRVAVLEKNRDVAGETSGRNSAVVHSGLYSKPGTCMAQFCVQGNREMQELCRELEVPYEKTGKLIVALCEADEAGLEALYEQGQANGCQTLSLISGEEAGRLVPGVKARRALLSPNTAILNPFLYCVALAEHAHENGVDFYFESPVDAIQKEQSGFRVTCGASSYTGQVIVNCAGLHADEIARLAGGTRYRIHPCRGEYLVLDEDRKGILPMPVYPAPREGTGGLGVHLTPTAEGNVIVGPSAVYINKKEDYAVTEAVLSVLAHEAGQLMPALQSLPVIGSYSGIRPKLTSPEVGGYHDFIIEEDQRVSGLFNMVGIESPGLTASLPAARYMKSLIGARMVLKPKEDWNPLRKGIPRFRDADEETQKRLIAGNPEYGEILCRCRKITKAEIRAAIENPLGVRSISGIKYRAWALTGRCHGGYCLPRIAQMLSEEYGLDATEIRYRNAGSELFTGDVK